MTHEKTLPLPAKHLSLEIATGDSLEPRTFSVHEQISSLFLVTVTAVSENQDIDFDAVVGQPARFSLETGRETRSWSGICNHLQQLGIDEAGLSTYGLTVVPSLWLLTQRRNYRTFQQLSETDIVLRLLEEWEITPDVYLTGTYKARRIRVQYGESDYAFISRMLEDAGVSFYFVEDAGRTKLVLSDAPQANEPRAPIPFRDKPLSAPAQEHVTAVRIGKRVLPGRYTMRDHDYRQAPGYALVASAEAEDGGLEAKLEDYHYTPGAFLFRSDQGGDETPFADDRGRVRTDEKEAQSVVEKRLQATRASAKVCSFKTNAHDLSPGMVIKMHDHPKSELGPDRRLLLLESMLSGAYHGEWTHQCEAVSAEAPYRPPLLTPKPRVTGVESATVVGKPGEEIDCDEFGRVRVHFHWDRESKMDDKSSCWIHVSQPWGGAGFGAMNLPRVGQEVIVDFLSGDPDRPVIVGRVYTNLQKVPYKLPANKTQSGIRTSSTGGGGGYSEIMFEDAAGRELVRFQAERDFTGLVKHDYRMNVQHDRTQHTGHDETESVFNDRTVRIGNDLKVSTKRDRVESVGRESVSQAIEGGATHLAKGLILHWSEKEILLSVGAASFIKIAKDEIVIQSGKVYINPGAPAIPPPPQPAKIGDPRQITGFIGEP